MSLNRKEVAQTAQEFKANLAASGLAQEELRERTGLSTRDFEAAFTVNNANPVHVWIVRDKLETAVKEAGGTLTPFSKLQESMRSAAHLWFGVEDYR